MDLAGGEFSSGRAIKAHHPTRLEDKDFALPDARAALGKASGGLVRFEFEQPVLAVVFAPLEPWVGVGQCLRVPLGNWTCVAELPLPIVGPEVEQDAKRRGRSHSASSVMTDLHVMGAFGA
jgi:hypothetical protein